MSMDKPGKMLLLLVMDILREKTDEAHTMTQKEILDELISRGYSAERKRFSEKLKALVYGDDRVRCTIRDRKGNEYSLEDAPEGAIYTDFYYEHLFTKGELQALVYSTIFNRHVSASNKEDIVEKLQSLNPLAFKHKLDKLILNDHAYRGEFQDLFMNMEDLEEAIYKQQLVSFRKKYYRPDKTVCVSRIEYVVMPLAIVAGKGDYYLLACPCAFMGVQKNPGKSFTIHKKPKPGQDQDTVYLMRDLGMKQERAASYTYTIRIDRIRNLKVLDSTDNPDSKTMKQISDLRKGIQKAQEHATRNADLSSGRIIKGSFRLTSGLGGMRRPGSAHACNISDVIDYFGKSAVTIQDEGTKETTEGKVQSYLVRVETNEATFLDFAKTNLENVQVLSPESAKQHMAFAIKTAYNRMAQAEGADHQ